MLMIVKNYSVWNLPYLQANRQDFMDAERRHDTPGSETKDFVFCSIARSMSFTFPHFLLSLKSFYGAAETQWVLHMQWVYIKIKDPQLLETPIFYLKVAVHKYAQHLPQRETLFLLSCSGNKFASVPIGKGIYLSSLSIYKHP